MTLYIDIYGVRSFSLLPFLPSFPSHPFPSPTCFFSLWLFSLLFQSTGQLFLLPLTYQYGQRALRQREKIIRNPRPKLWRASETWLWAQLTWNLHPWIIWVVGADPSERSPFSQDLLSHQTIARHECCCLLGWISSLFFFLFCLFYFFLQKTSARTYFM